MKKNSSKPNKKARTIKSSVNKKLSAKLNVGAKLDSESRDVVSLILRDHKPIKELILILKDPVVSVAKKRPAFTEFERILPCHAKAEEESLYVYLKEMTDLRIKGLEGETEHALADELMKEISESKADHDTWMAKVKVLAELVEHHVKEEEKEVLKKVREEFNLDKRIVIGEMYSRLLNKYRSEENETKNYFDQSNIGAKYA